MKNKSKVTITGFSALILIAIFLFAGLTSSNWAYFLSRRLPKVLAIILTSCAIGFSSTVFQTVTNNRILTPSVLGLDSLYMVIQTFLIFVLGSTSIAIINKNINFILSVVLMLVFSILLYQFIFRKEGENIMFLLLVGLIMGTLFQSLSSFMQMVIDPNEFLHVQDKMFASFNNVNTDILLFSYAIVIVILLISIKDFKVWDVLSLGRDQALNLGVDYDRVVKKILFIVSILVSISTALVGPITFLGLLAVNLSRQLLKTYKHSYLIISSTLVSILALIGGQLLVERIFNFGTPISVLINFIGGIYFIYLLVKENAS